jgi:hypothetical protein
MNVSINHRREDTVGVAMGFRQTCKGKEKTPLECPVLGIFKQKRIVVIFLAGAFLAFWYFNLKISMPARPSA